MSAMSMSCTLHHTISGGDVGSSVLTPCASRRSAPGPEASVGVVPCGVVGGAASYHHQPTAFVRAYTVFVRLCVACAVQPGVCRSASDAWLQHLRYVCCTSERVCGRWGLWVCGCCWRVVCRANGRCVVLKLERVGATKIVGVCRRSVCVAGGIGVCVWTIRHGIVVVSCVCREPSRRAGVREGCGGARVRKCCTLGCVQI